MAVGDNLGGQRADNQLLDRTLSAAVSKGAKQFILVTPLGGGGGGGLFGGLWQRGRLVQEAQQDRAPGKQPLDVI